MKTSNAEKMADFKKKLVENLTKTNEEYDKEIAEEKEKLERLKAERDKLESEMWKVECKIEDLEGNKKHSIWSDC